MSIAPQRMQLLALNAVVIVSAVSLVWMVVFISREFGGDNAAMSSLLFAIPLVIAVRLRRRWSTVSVRELAFLLILCCTSASGSGFLIRMWYADGIDRYHAEDVKWAKFKRRLHSEPAFKDIEIHRSQRKNIYWASGMVKSKADLVRLQSLAAECGIEGRRLDGPYKHSISLSVNSQ